MDRVKLEIDGKRLTVEPHLTILEAARRHGIDDIPTLCHDGQLEPFAACFLCVVEVRGARTLLPACSTRVQPGMVVRTDTPEVRRSRKAALELMLSNHYADCIGPCRFHCPAGIDIQGYVALAALGKYEDAIRLIKQANPLPAVCGRVCTRPCEVNGCRRNLLDDPVGIDYIKRYVADLDLAGPQPWRPEPAPRNGRRVAVIGGGPAGLSASYYLALKGYAATIFEALPEAGGMLRYGIPEYRLPKAVLDREIAQILDLGVELRTGVTLGRDITVAGLRRDGWDAVFLGIGAWDTAKMRVQDEETPGVLPGIEFLREYGLRRAHRLPGRVLVVGGGNTAIDCARTSLRLGADEVRLLYRRTRAEMPANATEIEDAEHEGVIMDLLVAPTRVVVKDGRAAGLECRRMRLGEPDASGRRSPVPVEGSEFVVEGDWVIAAIGQSTQAARIFGAAAGGMLPDGERLELTRWQTVQVDPGTFETSVEGVFSGGDVVTGAATAIEAIAAGRKAAHAIDAYLQTGRARPEPVEFFSRKDAFRTVTTEDLREGPRHGRRTMPMVPVAERVQSFVEVEQGYTAADLAQETARCLECGCTALYDCDLRRYATEYGAEVENFLGEAREYRVDRSHPLIELDQNKCILCGRCVRICSELVGVAAYGFVNRGFNTAIRPALTGSLLDTDCVSCGLCIGTCPTGAVAEISQLAKPGPWPTAKVPTICTYCGVGCRLDHEVHGGTLVRVAGRGDDAAVGGNHCRKGRFGYGYVRDRDRLLTGRVRAGRELREATVDEALDHAAACLRELRRKRRGEEFAVFVSPRLTNEEIHLARRLAHDALGTTHVASLADLVNRDLACDDVAATATYADLEGADVVVVAGAAPCDEHFTVDLLLKKAQRRGARLVYVGPRANRTSRFADVFLTCDEGGEVDVVRELARASAGVPAAGDLAAAAALLAGGSRKVLVCNRDRDGRRRAGDVRLLAEAAAALGCGLLPLREKANQQGLRDLTADTDVAALAARLRERSLAAVVVIGEDPFGAPGFPEDLCAGLAAADLLVVMDLFLTPTAQLAHVVLPLSAAAETSGTMTSSERRVQSLAAALPPATGVESWRLLARLTEAIDAEAALPAAGPADVLADIRRRVPGYADVAVDAAGTAGLARGPAVAAALINGDGPALFVPRVPTLGLDCLERHHAQWFDAIMARARERLAAAT